MATSGGFFSSSKAPEQVGTFWGTIKGQKYNILGMMMMGSVFLLSTKLLSMDRELDRVKKSREESQEEADEMRRKVKGLQESILGEVSRAGNARDSMSNLRSRLQVLMDERFADMNISQQGAGESANNGESEQNGKSFMV